jgi:hypothetical protein
MYFQNLDVFQLRRHSIDLSTQHPSSCERCSPTSKGQPFRPTFPAHCLRMEIRHAHQAHQEALAEIKAAAKKETVPAAEGAVLFL